MQVTIGGRTRTYPLAVLLVAVMLFLSLAPESRAVGVDEVSYSAAMTAGMRAVAARHPDEKIRNPDYLAEKLVPPNFWVFGVLHKDYARSMQFVKAFRVSAFYTINASSRHIDDLLKKGAQSGLRQVVNVGAGFDSRPYRFSREMPGIHFFEIELPYTSARKQAAVKSLLGELPANVTYIPAEYRTRHFINTLKRAGFDEKARTLFLWENNSAYMDPKVMDVTLRYIAQRTNPKNRVVMTYIPEAFVRGEYGKMGWVRFRELRARAAGEPWKFGIPHQKTTDFFNRRGFKVIADIGAKELADRYLIRSDGKPDGKPTPYVRLVHAGVAR